MTTQIGQATNQAGSSVPAAKPVGNVAQTKGAVTPAIPPADTGEESRSQEREARQFTPKHPALATTNARLTIEKDSDTGKYVYKTVDRETGKVIRQWPREKMLKAIAENRETSGLIVDKKV